MPLPVAWRRGAANFLPYQMDCAMKLSVFTVVAGLFLLFGGCSGGFRLPDTAPEEERPQKPEANVTWYGEIPCADCRVQKMTFTLFDDSTFRIRQRYEGVSGGGERVTYDTGRWERKKGKLLLMGSARFPLQFRYVSPSKLMMLDQMGNEIVSKLDYSLERRQATDFLAGPMELTGMFSSANGVTRFRECRTGKSYPLVFERPDPSVREQYARLRSSPGSSVLAVLRGRFLMDAGSGGEQVLVQEFGGFLPGRDCSDNSGDARPLENTFWRLLSLKGYDGDLRAAGRQPYLLLKSSDRSVRGFSGCNTLAGAYQLQSTSLSFGRLATSRMACPGGAMALESAFVRALEKTASWRVRGRILELYDSRSKPLMNFEAVSGQ